MTFQVQDFQAGIPFVFINIPGYWPTPVLSMTFPVIPGRHPVFSITFRLRSSFSVQFLSWDSARLGGTMDRSTTPLTADGDRFTVSAEKALAACLWGGVGDLRIGMVAPFI
jgi:hypothetical protein